MNYISDLATRLENRVCWVVNPAFLLLIMLVPFRGLCSFGGIGYFSANFNISPVIVSPGTGSMTLAMIGPITETSCSGVTSGYKNRILWFGDIDVNGYKFHADIKPGTPLSGSGVTIYALQTKPMTISGISGVAVIFSLAPADYQTFDVCRSQIGGQWQITNLGYTGNISAAIPAGTYNNIKFPVIYQEVYSTTGNESGALINNPSVLVSGQVDKPIGTVTVSGYCASPSFNPSSLTIDHGALTSQTVNGDTKTGSISYQCNIDTLPIIKFSGTSNNFTDINLCNGVSSHLTYNTVMDGQFQFTTTFTSALSRTPQSTCSGAFSGSTVVSVTYN